MINMVNLTLVFALMFLKIAACEVYYIKSANSTDRICLTRPCFTLNDFIVQTQQNLSTIKIIRLIFLPGNHSLDMDLHITATEKVLFFSLANSSWIVCEHSEMFHFVNIANVRMKNMRFLGCGGSTIFFVRKFTIDNCTFLQNKFSDANGYYTRLIIARFSAIEIKYSRFIQNIMNGIILAVNCNLSSSHNVYDNNTSVILTLKEKSFAIFDGCSFNNNIAMHDASFGVVNFSRLLIQNSWMMGNTEMDQAFILAFNGSYVGIQNCSITNNSFEKNSSNKFSTMMLSYDGIIILNKTTVKDTYSYTTGNVLIGFYSNIMLSDCKFIHNIGQNYTFFLKCSNIYTLRTTVAHNHNANGVLIGISDGVKTDLRGLIISKNKGDVVIIRSKVVISNGITFMSNNGSFIIKNSFVTFYSNGSTNSFTKCRPFLVTHKGGTITSEESTLDFYGTTYFLDNLAHNSGGAIYATDSKVHMYGETIISNNIAKDSGGGVYLYHSEFNCYFNCTFYQNRARLKGGGIHALDSKIAADVEFLKEHQKRYLLFAKNSGTYGGAINLEKSSKISLLDDGLSSHYNVTFVENIADYGGALYIDDTVSRILCESRYYSKHSIKTECFLMAYIERHHSINFTRNSALISGSSVFGGLLDRCTVNTIYTEDPFNFLNYSQIIEQDHGRLSGFSFIQAMSNIKTTQISSLPARICFCTYNRPNCSLELHSVYLQRGEKLSLDLAIVDQVNKTINGTVHIVTYSVKEYDSVKQSYYVPSTCTNLKVSVPRDPKYIVLYAVGPCNSTGISERIIKISLSECTCPIGFLPSENVDSCKCECDPILSKYNIKYCILETQSIVRENNVWIGYVNSTTYSGYLVYPNCPFDYCRPATPHLSINLNTPNGSDAQCVPHRTGVLCGRCKDGYSLALSGTVCLSCPKSWPGLLVANLIAQGFTGVLLVGLILLLDLTVAAGTFNGLLFYANVVSANKSNFIPFDKPNFLTIFIAFLNLESGIARCHIKDMDAYISTWVTLIYPLYINSLVVLVVVISRYSSLFSRIISKGNPVAALATLILFSYTKILRTIIDILSFAILKYPDGTIEVVWLYDASVKYLQGKHIPLFLTAVIILIVGITYTVLLFSWQWLLRAPHYKMLSWIRNTKLNSFMDAYLAPHTIKHRQWIGLLLFARIILYLLSAVNMSGDPSFNLLVIGTIVACLILVQLYSRNRIYKNIILDGFETTTYFNLLLFTLASFFTIESKSEQRKVAYVSILIAFSMFLSGLFYHIFLCLRKSECTTHFGRFLKQMILQRRQRHDNDLQVNLIEYEDNQITNMNAPTSTVVSVSPDHNCEL